MGRITSSIRFPCFLVLAAIFSTGVLVRSEIAKNGKSDESKSAAQAFLDKAAALTNLEGPGSKPFLLIADTNWTQNGVSTDGHILVGWQDPNLYREEVAFPGFDEAFFGKDDVRYHIRSAAYTPLVAVQWATLVPIWKFWETWPKDKSKIDDKHIPKELTGTSNFSCVTVETALGFGALTRTGCFDNASGLPLILQYEATGEIATVKFSDYVPIGDKYFPRDITYADRKGTHGEVKASKLVAVTHFAEEAFQPPANSTPEPWCADPTFENSSSRQSFYANLQGPLLMPDAIYYLAFVGTKGDVKNAFFLPASPKAAPERLLSGSIYNATMPIKLCGKKPIPYELVLHVSAIDEYP